MEIFNQLISYILIGGALGGIVSGLVKQSNLEITLPGGKTFNTGFLGDALVGIAASFSIFFVLGSVFNITINSESTSSDYIKILALCVIAGFSGRALLTKLSNDILGKVEQIEEDIEEIKDMEKYKLLLQNGAELAESHKHEDAILYFDSVLVFDPLYSEAICRKAMSLKRIDRVEEALELMESLVEKDPTDFAGWYNKACYEMLLNRDLEQVLADLSIALRAEKRFRIAAATDPDFAPLRDNEQFRQLTTL